MERDLVKRMVKKDGSQRISFYRDEYADNPRDMTDELEAWGNNDVYGFVVEDCIKSNIHKVYTNVDKEDEDYEEVEWKESASCWGYYGELDKVEGWIFEENGLNKDDFKEE